MVAEEFGTGRGTLFDILDLLFGEDYVVPCDVRRADGDVGLGALQRPAGRRAVRRGQRGHRRGRAPADAAPPALRRAEECHRSVADAAAALRGEGAARLRAALGDEPDHRDPASRCGEAAARRPALRSPHLRPQDDARGAGRDPGLDGGPGEYRRAASGAAGDAGGAARRV